MTYSPTSDGGAYKDPKGLGNRAEEPDREKLAEEGLTEAPIPELPASHDLDDTDKRLPWGGQAHIEHKRKPGT